ncbi:hypothetical protein CNYM01_08476 [Colletotrichum nymphaeae SA-01]|uniref:Tat pathway signal sequence n=1 Tax=Colletotrichum nymphaeae SA-01 TaxID=1460502 RepID=A0A135TE76_9PEZI|nr:hypothetical protein CNYM01_08476 [Colletotrichum nymphaeae SA-01]
MLIRNLLRQQKPERVTYESLEQEDGRKSEPSDDIEYVSVKNISYKRKVLISLILNLVLSILIITFYAKLTTFGQRRRLLPSPVPQCDYVANWNQSPKRFGPSKSILYFFRYLPKRVTQPRKAYLAGALRHFMWDVIYGRVDAKEMLQHWPQNVSAPTYHEAINGLWHIAHCFDYLRQAVQCSGDTSLEFVSENTGRAVVDGLDYPHECKNWDEVWAYAARYA